MSVPRKQSFVSKNLVALVMIPSLIGIHIGWRVLQDNRKLVTADEQIDLPPITFAKHIWKRLTAGSDPQADSTSSSAK